MFSLSLIEYPIVGEFTDSVIDIALVENPVEVSWPSQVFIKRSGSIYGYIYGSTVCSSILRGRGEMVGVAYGITLVGAKLSIDHLQGVIHGSANVIGLLMEAKYHGVITGVAVCSGVLHDKVYMPTDLGVVWVQDYVYITWTDTNSGKAQYEIYQSFDGVDYVLVDTVAVGTTSYGHITWQNDYLYYKIRAKSGTIYSDYTTEVTIQTPITLKAVVADGGTISQPTFNVYTGKFITVDWGDGTTPEVKTGNNANYNHTYTNAGTYWIHWTGDTNDITNYRCNSNTTKLQHSISYWRWPSRLNATRMYSNSITGIMDSTTSNLVNFTENEFNSCYFNGDWSGCTTVKVNKFPYNDLTDIPRASSIHTHSYVDLRDNNVSTEKLDAFFVWWHSFIDTNPPTKSCDASFIGATMGIPTGGINNVDILALQAAYTAAGFVLTIAVRTS